MHQLRTGRKSAQGHSQRLSRPSQTHQLAKVVDLPEESREAEVVCALDAVGREEVGLDVDASKVEQRALVVVGVLGLCLERQNIRQQQPVGPAPISPIRTLK